MYELLFLGIAVIYQRKSMVLGTFTACAAVDIFQARKARNLENNERQDLQK